MFKKPKTIEERIDDCVKNIRGKLSELSIDEYLYYKKKKEAESASADAIFSGKKLDKRYADELVKEAEEIEERINAIKSEIEERKEFFNISIKGLMEKMKAEIDVQYPDLKGKEKEAIIREISSKKVQENAQDQEIEKRYQFGYIVGGKKGREFLLPEVTLKGDHNPSPYEVYMHGNINLFDANFLSENSGLLSVFDDNWTNVYMKVFEENLTAYIEQNMRPENQNEEPNAKSQKELEKELDEMSR